MGDAKKEVDSAKSKEAKASTKEEKKVEAKQAVESLKVPAPIKEKAEKAYKKYEGGHRPKISPEVKAAAQKAYDKLHAKGVVKRDLGAGALADEDSKQAAYVAWKKYQASTKAVKKDQTWPIGVGNE